MKRSVLYIAAVTALTGTMMWGSPMVSHAEPEAELVEAAVEMELSQVILVDEDHLGELALSGPDAAVQLALEEAKAAEEAAALAEAEALAAEKAVQDEQTARQNLVNYALQFVGGRYRAGGNDPHTGADCSGFTKYVMQHGAGIALNRSSGAQAAQGRTVSASQMQPGDLIFYGNGSRVNHVALYIGGGQIVHASTYKTGIKISNWNYRTPVRIASMF
ncbi:MAG: C40 family peptidase [Eubacteriales bacterium]|nr:C40 family peptidase [Eubacteriales bacterium]